MRNLSTTEMPPLEFTSEEKSRKINALTHKIGWLHTLTDQPGASFDIQVKDALGRVKFEKRNCKSETVEYGELVNEPTLLGEELEVVVSNLEGAESVQVFLN